MKIFSLALLTTRDHPCVEVHSAQEEIEGLAADIIEEDVECPGLADEILLERRLLVVECLRHAGLLLEPAALLVRARRRVYCGTLILREDARYGADSAGGARHDNNFARLYLP